MYASVNRRIPGRHLAGHTLRHVMRQEVACDCDTTFILSATVRYPRLAGGSRCRHRMSSPTSAPPEPAWALFNNLYYSWSERETRITGRILTA